MTLRRPISALVLALSVAAFTGCDEITGGDDATIVVENNASVTVFYMYISECTDDDWGEDELGSETIAPGEEEEFDVDAGCWDLRAEFSDDTFAEDFGIELDEGDEFTWELVD
jgi:hypothetical protein